MDKNEAIENNKKLWSWIADKTKERNRVVLKREYFEENNLEYISNGCYLCEYVLQHMEGRVYGFSGGCCEICPFKEYFKMDCLHNYSPYYKWLMCCQEEDIKGCVKYARRIAGIKEIEK